MVASSRPTTRMTTLLIGGIQCDGAGFLKPSGHARSNTRSASSTLPNGADTWTPCTASYTRSNISCAIAMPSATACSFDFSFARRIRVMMLSGTVTPGTSFARHSPFRTDTHRIAPDADHELRRLPDLVPPGIEPLIEILHEVREPDRVDVEDSRRV